MQSGNIYKHHGNWQLRYYDVAADGTKKRVAVKLAKIGRDYPTKSSVWSLAQKHLTPINSGLIRPESNFTVCHFVENYYWPFIDEHLKPATRKNYRDFYRCHLKDKLGIRLRDFRTVDCQNILDGLKDINHTSKLRVKSLLSGIFTYALQRGFIDGHNPVTSAVVRGRPVSFKRLTYSMSDVQTILEAVKDDPQASAVIAVAAFAGLRVGEIAGLKWSDFDGKFLYIRRSVWRTNIGLPKTDGAVGAVPVLDILRDFLDTYRQSLKDPRHDDFMFAGSKKKRPLNLNNLARRTIIPALKKYEEEIQESIPWRYWHSFRAGLASNLYELGVDAGVIQNILRHVDLNMTMRYYVTVQNDKSVAALQQISDWYKNL